MTINLAEALYRSYQDKGYLQDKNRIIGLQNKLKGATKPCLTLEEIDILTDFKKRIITTTAYVEKLEQYHRIIFKLGSLVFPNDNNGILQAQWLLENVERLQTTNEMVDKIEKEIESNPKSILAITGALIALAIKKETYEYILKRYLDDTVKKQNLLDLDVENILSMESKVWNEKSKRFVPDITAIKDCISHGHFRIVEGENYRVIFHWVKDGEYNFHREFTEDELFRFLKEFLDIEDLRFRIFLITLYQFMMKEYLLKSSLT